MPSAHSFMVLPELPAALKSLDMISRNVFWSWNSEYINLFKRIDGELWEKCGHNPVKLLANVSQETLEKLAANHSFVTLLNQCEEKLTAYLASASWYEKRLGQKDNQLIAYFSAEFGIHESLPIYSGGLGGLAGDHLKSASDLGLPLAGVGLMYQKGYFCQYLNIDGWQQEVYNDNDFYNMPMSLVKKEDGTPIIINVRCWNREVHAQVWAITVGKVKLYLLDTNIDSNTPEDRMITANLYGGDSEMRIKQEILLGIGGLRALFAMGTPPTVCHMNEGHAAFMALERIRQLRMSNNMSFDEAMEASKAGNVFTTHTPVQAGNDEFSPELIEKYFVNYYGELGLTKKRFLELGRINPENEKETFKMPVLAIKLSSYQNGVSKLHGEVSRKMWAGLWPKLPLEEVPIQHVTNGIHTKNWLSEEMQGLYERYLGAEELEGNSDESNWDNISNIPDEEFWRTHQRCKGQLIAFARNRLKAQMQRRGTYHTELHWADEVLDPEILTIGFARRFATYKRGNLLLKDPKRLMKILNNPHRPVQIVFAGKAHPKDTEGKEIIRQIIHFANQYEVRKRIVFLEDYDINVARMLVRGVDIWLNTPRPPMEASGTSGMKAAVNGALNMSTYDGWWCEGYNPECGWVIGAGETYDDATYQDTVESQAIYNILENEVIPLFYTRSEDNLPRAWIHRVKNSVKRISPQFSTHRMVSEYAKMFYGPAAERWQYLTTDAMARAKALSVWKSKIRAAWSDMSIRDVQVDVSNGNGSHSLNTSKGSIRVGARLDFRALVKLGSVSPENISVELYYGTVNTWGEIYGGSSVEMSFKENGERSGEYWFDGSLVCRNSGHQAVAVRVLPKNPDLVNPYELGLVLWETSSAKSSTSNN